MSDEWGTGGVLLSVRNNQEFDRVMVFERIHNFRDIGGIRTSDGRLIKRGLLFRSGDWSQASDGDMGRIAALGIRTVLDLRGARGYASAPDRLLQTASRASNLPMVNSAIEEFAKVSKAVRSGQERDATGEPLFVAAYRTFPEAFADQMRVIFGTLTVEEDLPLVIHCANGKDRTGFAVAIVLASLGVEDRAVLDDYLLTNACMSEVFEHRLSDHPFPDRGRTFLTIQAKYLDASFNAIREEYGSVAAYLKERVGVTEEQLSILKTLLLEPSVSS